MGIPKFFRWISERYPLLSQLLANSEIDLLPVVDNLYLDMNGIIHHCTHPNNQDEERGKEYALTEDEMFVVIAQYIDKLFHLIKPQKLFYMAVDGVAPRAKLNQQRQRRFRTAHDAKLAKENELEHNNNNNTNDFLDEKPHFDSNCITPGTNFMYQLSERLKFFIKQRMNEDYLWRNVTVVFSGQEVPGEGEHKIMEYIRHKKCQPDWDPNTSHCLYGLDADLIMLALTTHEPHFYLLREEVLSRRGGKNDPKKSSKQADGEEKFQLLHIGLVREYLQLEFGTIGIPFDLERVIDDFVLMCFFVGNDFLPTLPKKDIAEGALSDFLRIYKQKLKEWGGYLTDGAKIDLKHLEDLLKSLSVLEKHYFQLLPKEGLNDVFKSPANSLNSSTTSLSCNYTIEIY